MKLNLFKKFKLNWWQAGFFKSAAVSFGIILGISFPVFFSSFLNLLWVVFIVSSLYILYIWAKQ